ncbi:uncharacterized protein LOC113237770 isoform X2 [Hyposmocoma kahamanoa]|nr:uncharacterized protein LOC113237770 isoform X2 [Hyposmocoma kahamanoa]
MHVGFILSCVSSLSPNWYLLGVLKFLSVCFSCAANSATYTLVGESCVQRVRSKYMLLMTCLLLLSPAIAGALAYPTLKLDFAAQLPWLGIVFRPWRLLIIVFALPSGVGAVAISFFYESPKFLANWERKDEALDVLKSMYTINRKTSANEYKVKSIILEDESVKKKMSVYRALYEQSAPLFRPPYLWRTLQLFYIIFVVYITNNSFLTWLPHILNLVRLSMENNGSGNNICSLISSEQQTEHAFVDVVNGTNSNATVVVDTEICLYTIEENVMVTLIASQSIFSFLNFVISYLPNYRKAVLVSILSLSSLSGVCLNLTPEPISSVFFFVVFTCTCLGMGILASYFVDLYPTSYRGMVQCLGIMVGRSSAFVGINVVGNVFFENCQVTFYLWSLLVFSSAVAACFLPPDKSKITSTAL